MTAPLADVRWTAVLIGSMADIGGSTIASLILGIAVALTMLAPGETAEQLQTRLFTDPAFLTIELALGLACSGLGAFVAARLARRREQLHGLLAAGLGLVFGMLFTQLVHENPVPAWYRVAGYLLVFPVAWLGAVAARALNRRSAQ